MGIGVGDGVSPQLWMLSIFGFLCSFCPFKCFFVSYLIFRVFIRWLTKFRFLRFFFISNVTQDGGATRLHNGRTASVSGVV